MALPRNTAPDPDTIARAPSDGAPSTPTQSNHDMSRLALLPALASLLAVAALTPMAGAQHTDHAAHMRQAAADSGRPTRATLPGQDAFGAIAEIVTILRQDPATDWSRVDIERLRQHLIDMHEVTLRAAVASRPVPGGVQLTVTGEGRTRDAIRRMLSAHGAMLAAEGLEGEATPVPAGVRWTVTTRDSSRVAELRALGLVGILTLGDHHTTHHLQLARGTMPAGHH